MNNLTTKRLMSLDVFRGITIAGMILVNNPGSWASIYAPLQHAKWHGWTPTDLVFPFFLFIAGVSIVFALPAGQKPEPGLLLKILRRALTLFLLGLALAAYPFFQWEPEFGLRPELASLRIMGVLQRIAVCYLMASLLYLYLRPKTLHYVVLPGLLLLYWLLMSLVPVPGYGPGLLDEPEGNLAAYLDRLILGEHLWVGANRRWDPEGLLSSLPAVATVLFGIQAGRILRSGAGPEQKTLQLFVQGIGLVMAGYCWDWFFPINKNLWSSSYSVFTAGQAFCALGLCYYLVDQKGYSRWALPFKVYGVNAITVFVGSGLLSKTLSRIKLLPEGQEKSISLSNYIYKQVYDAWFIPNMASLLYALSWVLLWLAILWWMYRRNLIVKI